MEPGTEIRAELARHEMVVTVAALVVVVVLGLWGTDRLLSRAYTPGVKTVVAAEMDFDDVTSVAERKRRFFDFVRPIVVAENARVARQRERLLAARRTGLDRRWVRKMAREYRVAWNGNDASWDELLARVDTVPVELALAQAAHESRWGTSRFALDGNNLFGQWCYRDECGIVPLERPEGATHKVAAFAHVNEAVRNYLFNINVGHAYGELRQRRAAFRKAGQRPDPFSLAAGLTRYSERGTAYVEEIRRMIRLNRQAMLGGGGSRSTGR